MAARAIGVVEGTVRELVVQDDSLQGVRMDDGRVIHRDALFVPPWLVPNSILVVNLGCDADTEGWVTADRT